MMIEIRDRKDQKTLFEGEFDNLKEAIIAAIAEHADLNEVNTNGMSLSYIGLQNPCVHKTNPTNLKTANLEHANLSCSDLSNSCLVKAALKRTKYDE